MVEYGSDLGGELASAELGTEESETAHQDRLIEILQIAYSKESRNINFPFIFLNTLFWNAYSIPRKYS